MGHVHPHVGVLGFEVWRGEGVPPASPGRVGLHHWTIVLDDPGEVEAVRGWVREAGIATEEREAAGGLLVRGPLGIAVVFVADTT